MSLLSRRRIQDLEQVVRPLAPEDEVYLLERILSGVVLSPETRAALEDRLLVLRWSRR